MNNIHINTYCSGFQLYSIKNITRKEFVELCNNLQKEFNNHYNVNDYSFSPECITEGGIIFNNYNNNIDGYKTIRLFFTENNVIDGKREKLYGFINENIKNEWIMDEGILIEKDRYLGTFLKSFHNAPKWTKEELRIFKYCFNNIGLIIKKSLLKN
jgi:hypothetical protein